jgi:hypothetical protein
MTDASAFRSIKSMVREIVGDDSSPSRTYASEQQPDGRGGIVISAVAESNQALLWIRGPAGDLRPALVQAMVPFDEESPIVFADGSAPLDGETAYAVEVWLAGAKGQCRPSGPAPG